MQYPGTAISGVNAKIGAERRTRRDERVQDPRRCFRSMSPLVGLSWASAMRMS